MRPILFSFLQYDVRSAPVFAGVGVLCACLYFRSQKRALGLSLDDFWNLMLALMVGLFLGAVLFYAALYGQGLASNLAPLRRGAVAGGSFFGVLWGAAAGAYLFCRVQRRPFGLMADVLAASAALGLVPMRVGCLLNGCCHGSPTDLPWAVVFRDRWSAVPAKLLGVPLHPSQFYEAAAAFAFFLVLHLEVLPRVRDRRLEAGSGFLLFVAAYALWRLATDPLRGSDPGLLSVAGLSTAQLVSLLSLAGAALFAALRRRAA